MISLEQKISNWISKYLENNNLQSLVIGISGGIDSAVTSTLCAMTGSKTYVVIMPIHQNSDETNRGIDHCNWLTTKFPNVEMIKVDLTESFEQFKNNFSKKYDNKLALANTRARLRMITLYLIAGNKNGIVAGTGNKVEDFGVGFYTKYGDGGVDISPIADLMKSEVFELGKKIGVIDSILNAKPTDGLWDDERTDEDQLGVSYDELEWAMNFRGDISSLSEKQKHILDIYNKHRRKNIHKMIDIPVFKNE